MSKIPKVPVSILKRTARSDMAATDSSAKRKPLLLNKTSFKPTRYNPIQSTIPSQRQRLLATTTLDDFDRSCALSAGTKFPDPNDSSIAKRLTSTEE